MTNDSPINTFGALSLPPYGYAKPLGAKTDRQLRKDPEAERIIRAVFRRIEKGASCSEVADWLNQHGH
ncbi:hypothetical protein [Schlesneria paludicola]|uniref:hypothetical protein n=1 Tax=Schlesneria paludicola TaxID=360056 RepID=UPI00029A3691|nr:hypothetical protein [Schlesneria paludicola]